LNRIAIPVLACLTTALGGIVAVECTAPPAMQPASSSAEFRHEATVAPHPGASRQVETWVDAILARPLFEPSRRPPAVTTASSIGGPGFPRLTGIIILPQRREAIFAVPGKTQPIVVAAGSRLDGVLIKTIDAGEVVIVDARGARIIRPAFAPTTSQPAAPSAAVLIDLPPVPSTQHAAPFASIRGLSGRPLGLVAEPDQTPPGGGINNTAPSLPPPAGPGGLP
jgi:hypothetical protein